MKFFKPLFVISFLVIITTLFLPLESDTIAIENKESYLVKVSSDDIEIPGVELEDIDILNKEGFSSWKRIDSLSESKVAEISSDPDVLSIQKELKFKLQDLPDDTYYNSIGSFYMDTYDQWNLRKIGLNPVPDEPEDNSAWEYSTGSSSTIIAVIDSGIDLTHPDLQDNIIAGRNFVSTALNPGTNNYGDEIGHGTHVSGIIAGVTNNNQGIAGICWDCKIMPLRVFGTTNTTTDTVVAAAINYAVDNGANIINLSLSGKGYSQIMQDAINYAWENGAIVIVSAGNEGDDVSLYSPAGLKNVIAVGATDRNDNVPSFSNFGPRIDLGAPGVFVLSTKLRSISATSCVSSSSYYCLNGTSMAAPHVSGIAALLYEYHLNDDILWSNLEIREALLKNADDIGTTDFDNYSGYGRLNSLRAIQEDGFEPDVVDPQIILTTPELGFFRNTINLTGTVNDENLYMYNIEFKRESNVHYLYTGRGNVQDSTLINQSHSLTEGAYNVRLYATDFRNNESVSEPIDITIDLTPPSAFALDINSNESTATISFSTTDSLSGMSHYQVSLNNGTFTNTTSPYTTPNLSNGTHSVQVKAVDRVGNERVVASNFSIFSRSVMLKSVGDLTGNGTVELSDLSILATYWNQHTSNGDVNGDGYVDISDLSILAHNWGQSF